MQDHARDLVSLPPVVRLADDLAAGRTSDTTEYLREVLAGLRQHLDMDVCFIGEFSGDQRVIRAVDSRLDAADLPTATEPAERTTCGVVRAGAAPEFVRDARHDPVLAALPVVQQLPVRTHISVLIRTSDGTPVGTLCAFSRTIDTRVEASETGIMRLVADLIGRHFERDHLPDEARTATLTEVAALLDSDGLETVFQPVVDLATMSVVAYEALSRFPDAVQPDRWFARASSVGMGIRLELAAIRHAVALLDVLPTDILLLVNVSAATLCCEPLQDLLDDVDVSRLVLELTEQTGIPDDDLLAAIVTGLRRRGAQVAVDDAGSGYAGLQRILRLSPDVIKLDRELVHGVDADEAKQALVAALTWFADQTGASLVAEGIEAEAEADMLRRLGVQLGQGFHLGAPGPLPYSALVRSGRPDDRTTSPGPGRSPSA